MVGVAVGTEVAVKVGRGVFVGGSGVNVGRDVGVGGGGVNVGSDVGVGGAFSSH